MEAITQEQHNRLPVTSIWTEPELAAIYEDNARSIYYLSLRMLGDESLAEDAMHDVFVKCYRKLHQFRGEANIRTWLYRITVNHCRNVSQSWHQRTMVNGTDDLILDTAGQAAPSPLRALETKELGHRIQATLNRMTPEYRLLLLLVADEKLSYQEVADLTDQTIDAVRGKLHRARKMFIQQFTQTS